MRNKRPAPDDKQIVEKRPRIERNSTRRQIMKKQIHSLAMVATCAMTFFASPANALEMSPTLSLNVDRTMAPACESLATQKGWRMNIAVVDGGAQPIVFVRMDRSFLGSGDIALTKAQTSAKFPFSTRFVQELSYGKDGKPAPLPGFVHVRGVVAFAGGLPIRAAGMHIGGIGVSGGTADEDETCAQAGIDAVNHLLK